MANLQSVGMGYTLSSFPDCTDYHHGQYEGLSIYVVGRHTPQEQLFARSKLAEATTYMNATGQSIENIATAELCDAAVLSVYG